MENDKIIFFEQSELIRNDEADIQCTDCQFIENKLEIPKIGEELCQHCGKTGYDRRTIIMPYFYGIDKFNTPFKSFKITGKFQHAIGKTYCKILNRYDDVYESVDQSIIDGSLYFYLLRVCKECRESWINYNKQWFLDKIY